MKTAEEIYLEIYKKAPSLMNFYDYKKATTDAMIEFAKMHVKAAIKECIESAPSGSSTDTVSYEDVVYALEDCYPESNIK